MNTGEAGKKPLNQGTLVARSLWRIGTKGVAEVKDHAKHDEDLE